MPGLVQLRSRIVAVIDPALWFGLSANADLTYLALLEHDHRPLGLLVAEVAGVRQIYADEIAEQSEVGAREGGMPVSFTTRDLITVLDVERLFALARCRSHASTGSSLHPSPGGSPWM
jgi:chemotaxis signal transduction protein